MFKGFSKRQSFSGFPTKSFGNEIGQWNGYRCDFWLDAGQLISSAIDGQRVDLWLDSMSNTRWVQPTLASRPFYVLSDPAFNNNPVVSNSGSQHLLNLDNQSVFKTGDQNFIAFVFEVTLVPTGSGRNTLFTQGTSIELTSGGTTDNRTGILTSAFLFASTSLIGTNTVIFLMSRNRILINGVFEVVTGTQSSGLLSFSTFNRLFGNAFGVPFNGKLAEVLCFPFNPTDQQMLDVSSLLNSKYAIY
jgi:hypothetical protein